MDLNTNHLLRCLETLDAAVVRYHKAAPDSMDREVFRNAIVKGYELSQETAFKLLRKTLLEFGYGARKLDALPVKEILRLAATHGLMTLEEVERWFAYRDHRNDTAHEYGEGFAHATLKLLPDFIADGKRLEATLRERLGHGRT
ncbi:MAG: nucleotidyltransferase substrate binding protein [Magnetococcales bacterium]|nr:nucleotidyltransferase substrate binding protein [Magnetococcales bacterium]